MSWWRSGAHLRRSLAGLVAVAVAVAAGCSAQEPAPASAASPPDIVLVVIDTLRADRLGAYGADRPTSPQLDALAARGLRFERAYAHSGWTLPSMATLLTGRLPHEHGAGRSSEDTTRFGRLPARVPTLAEALAAAGYTTHAIVNNTFLAPEFGLHRGFGSYDYAGATNTRHRSAAESVERALAWLDGGSRPAFLLLHVMEPHLDYAAPAPFAGRFAPEAADDDAGPSDAEVLGWLKDRYAPVSEAHQTVVRARYDEEVLAADAAVGALVRGLEARDRLATTLLVVTSDHGEEHWDHGGFEHGHTLRSELTRVPLILAGPGVAPGVVSAVVSQRDLHFALRAVAGLEGAPEAVGECGPRDLFALARGEAPDAPRLVLLENTRVRGQRLGAVDARHHLEVEPAGRRAEVWRIDERGADAEALTGEEADAAGRRLLERVARCRGGLEAVAIESPLTLDPALFEQLEALGYLE